MVTKVYGAVPQLTADLELNGFKLDAGSGNDAVIKLGDAAGANKFSITDSADVEIASMDSIGQLTLDAATTYGITTGLMFGDGDTGFYESVNDKIVIVTGGTGRFFFDTTKFSMTQGITLLWEAPSDTNPVMAITGDLDTGVGQRVSNVGVLIGGAQNCVEFGGVSGAAELGFYGTAAIAQQTGVTVDAAGIHAALVSLGLITA